MTNKNMITRRNSLKAIAGAGLTAILSATNPSESLAREPLPHTISFRGWNEIGPIRLESDGEADRMRNDGRVFHDSDKPYVSIGTEKTGYNVVLFAPDDRIMSITFKKGNEEIKYGGIKIDKSTMPLKVETYGDSIVTINARENGLVPLIRAYGSCKITSPGNPEGFEIEWDNEDIYANWDKKVSKSAKNPKEKHIYPAFQLTTLFYEGVDGYPNGKYSRHRDIFVDCYGRVTETGMGLIGLADSQGNAIGVHKGYGFDDPSKIDSEGNTKNNNYFPTKSFAHFKDKKKFWDLPYDEQFDLRNATHKQLEQASRKGHNHKSRRGLFRGLFR